MTKAEKYMSLFREVEELQASLSEKHGVTIKLSVVVLSSVSLDDIEKVVTDIMHRQYPHLQSYNLRMRSRLRPTVIFRSIFYHFAKENGYRLHEMSSHVMQSHATAIHGIKTLESLLSINDFHAVKYYSMVREVMDGK